MKKVVIGIDLGGTNTTMGVVDREGAILWKSVFPTQADKHLDYFLTQVQSANRECVEALEGEVIIEGIGIGAPAGNARTGQLLGVNLSWENHLNFREVVSRTTALPVVLDNDANATAIGEMYFGIARELNDFILITLGTGLGSGIVVNRELVYGSDGLAGELGHVCVDMNGRDCNCGRKGCLETYASATGLKRTVFELMGQRRTASALREVSYHALNCPNDQRSRSEWRCHCTGSL